METGLRTQGHAKKKICNSLVVNKKNGCKREAWERAKVQHPQTKRKEKVRSVKLSGSSTGNSAANNGSAKFVKEERNEE